MDVSKKRYVVALIVGILLSGFGVFLFSNFQYRGLILQEHIFPLFSSPDHYADGMYQLLGSGLYVDWFTEFSVESINNSSIREIARDPAVWPVLVSWISTGILTGSIVKGAKRGLKFGMILILTVFLSWVVSGFFANADVTAIFTNNIETTLGNFFTALIFLLLGSVIGGAISGPFID